MPFSPFTPHLFSIRKLKWNPRNLLSVEWQRPTATFQLLFFSIEKFSIIFLILLSFAFWQQHIEWVCLKWKFGDIIVLVCARFSQLGIESTGDFVYSNLILINISMFNFSIILRFSSATVFYLMNFYCSNYNNDKLLFYFFLFVRSSR